MGGTSPAPVCVRLEDLTPGARVTGVVSDGPVTVIAMVWHGSNSLTLTYRTASGRLDEALLYRDHETRLGLIEAAAG